MAFIGTNGLVRHQGTVSQNAVKRATSRRSGPQCAHRASRRSALVLLGAVASSGALSALFPGAARGASELPGLPAGAREFSRVLGARRQWAELAAVLTSGRALEDGEWDSLRAYLRTIYQTSADMDFLSEPWDKPLRARATDGLKRFRGAVKAMDKPAADKDVRKVAELHAQVMREFDAFFDVLREASTGGIPEEL